MDLLIILFGLIFGSYYYVLAIRLLNGTSIAWPSSRCPFCRRWSLVELIPVFSYLGLGGKCKHCRAKISPLYPFGELATALSFYMIYRVHGSSLEMIMGLLLASLLVVAMLTDLHSKRILDQLTLPAIVVFLFLRWIFSGEEAWSFYFLGALTGFFLLYFIAWASRGGMGGGDIKLFAAIGAMLGPWLTLLSLVISSLLGALVGVGLIACGKVSRKQSIPFAPFIWAGTMVAYLFGRQGWNWFFYIT